MLINVKVCGTTKRVTVPVDTQTDTVLSALESSGVPFTGSLINLNGEALDNDDLSSTFEDLNVDSDAYLMVDKKKDNG